MHIIQTQKINLGANAVTDQLLTIMQHSKWNGCTGPCDPMVPAGGPETRMLNLYKPPKKMQQKWQVPNDKKNLQIESTVIQVIQWKDKRKKERDQYDLKHHFNSKLLTFCWTSSPRCLRTSQCSSAGSPLRGKRALSVTLFNPEVPQQDSGGSGLLSVPR